MSEQRRPGRPSRAEPTEALGFRASALLRKRMELARTFLDIRSHQALLEEAIEQRLESLRTERPRFAAAEDELRADVRENAPVADDADPGGSDTSDEGATITTIGPRKGRSPSKR